MFSLSQRFQDITGLLSSTIMFMSVLISILSAFQLNASGYQRLPGHIAVKETFNKIRYSRDFGGKYSSGKENVKLRFDLDADLTSLFNWNTKQVIVYLVGNYNNLQMNGINNSESKVVFWDRIIKDRDHAKIHLKNKKSKYSVYDYYPILSNKTATMKLEFNVQPWVGPLLWGTIDSNDTIIFADSDIHK